MDKIVKELNNIFFDEYSGDEYYQLFLYHFPVQYKKELVNYYDMKYYLVSPNHSKNIVIGEHLEIMLLDCGIKYRIVKFNKEGEESEFSF